MCCMFLWAHTPHAPCGWRVWKHNLTDLCCVQFYVPPLSYAIHPNHSASVVIMKGFTRLLLLICTHFQFCAVCTCWKWANINPNGWFLFKYGRCVFSISHYIFVTLYRTGKSLQRRPGFNSWHDVIASALLPAADWEHWDPAAWWAAMAQPAFPAWFSIPPPFRDATRMRPSTLCIGNMLRCCELGTH